MKKLPLIVVLLLLVIGFSIFYFLSFQKESVLSPVGKKIFEKPLEKYTFESLRVKRFQGSEISIGKLLKEGEGFTSYIFYFKDNGKKVSGTMNVPNNPGIYPIIMMFRGYVDKEKYTIGEGTRHSGEVLAQNNFVTLAPDFLGYGESDNPSNNSIEERFQSYTTSLSLIASLKNLNRGLDKAGINIKADPEKVGIWGHSNGGHIALSILELSGKDYPTVLWNPVSKPFPYSVLYFTDEFDDHGKALRRAIANFEKDYDIEKYSPTNFFDWIQAPIQLHQAIDDEAVPLRWSEQLNEQLVKLKKDVTYYIYPSENHNFGNGSWPTAIQRTLDFYKINFH